MTNPHETPNQDGKILLALVCGAAVVMTIVAMGGFAAWGWIQQRRTAEAQLLDAERAGDAANREVVNRETAAKPDAADTATLTGPQADFEWIEPKVMGSDSKSQSLGKLLPTELQAVDPALPWRVPSRQRLPVPTGLAQPLRMRFDGLLPVSARWARSGSHVAVLVARPIEGVELPIATSVFDDFESAHRDGQLAVDRARHVARVDLYDVRSPSSQLPLRLTFDEPRELLAISPAGSRVLLRSPMTGATEVWDAAINLDETRQAVQVGQRLAEWSERDLPIKVDAVSRRRFGVLSGEFLDEDQIVLHSNTVGAIVRMTISTGERTPILDRVGPCVLAGSGRLGACIVRDGVLLFDPMTGERLGNLVLSCQPLAAEFDPTGSWLAVLAPARPLGAGRRLGRIVQ